MNFKSLPIATVAIFSALLFLSACDSSASRLGEDIPPAMSVSFTDFPATGSLFGAPNARSSRGNGTVNYGCYLTSPYLANNPDNGRVSSKAYRLDRTGLEFPQGVIDEANGSSRTVVANVGSNSLYDHLPSDQATIVRTARCVIPDTEGAAQMMRESLAQLDRSSLPDADSNWQGAIISQESILPVQPPLNTSGATCQVVMIVQYYSTCGGSYCGGWEVDVWTETDCGGGSSGGPVVFIPPGDAGGGEDNEPPTQGEDDPCENEVPGFMTPSDQEGLGCDEDLEEGPEVEHGDTVREKILEKCTADEDPDRRWQANVRVALNDSYSFWSWFTDSHTAFLRYPSFVIPGTDRDLDGYGMTPFAGGADRMSAILEIKNSHNLTSSDVRQAEAHIKYLSEQFIPGTTPAPTYFHVNHAPESSSRMRAISDYAKAHRVNFVHFRTREVNFGLDDFYLQGGYVGSIYDGNGNELPPTHPLHVRPDDKHGVDIKCRLVETRVIS